LSTNKDSAKIGEPIALKVKLDYSADIGSVEWPEFKEDSAIGNNFEVWEVGDLIKQSEINENEALLSISQTINVVSFQTGFIPFLPVSVVLDGDTLVSNALLVTIAEVKVDTTQGFNDIKPVMHDPLTGWESFSLWISNNWWWMTIVLVAVAISLYFILRKKTEIAEPEIQISIYEKYLLRLDELLNKELWTKDKVKEHYLELTDLIRSYYFDRFGVSTFEKTTNEIITMTGSINIDNEVSRELNHVFKVSEFVKFAKRIPSEFEIQRHNKTTKHLIEVTQPAEQLQTEEK
jgi:hypothetical protein